MQKPERKSPKMPKWSILDQGYFWGLFHHESQKFLDRKFYFKINDSDEKGAAQIAAMMYLSGYVDGCEKGTPK